jgi:hypothetical protein
VVGVQPTDITATRQCGSDGAASVAYATGGGTATPGADYTAVSGTLFWAAGEMGPKTFTVDLLTDAEIEGPETICLTLSGASGAALGSSSRTVAAITIAGNVAPGAIFTQSGGSTDVVEGVSSDTYTVALTCQPTADVVVGVQPTDITATPATLTFTPANWNTPQTVTVSAADDTEVTGFPIRSGTISHRAASADPNYLGISLGRVIVNVTETDVAFQFSSGTYAAADSDGFVTITVDRVGGSLGPASVLYATGGGTAVPGTDYVSASGTLNWADGESGPKTFAVSLITNSGLQPSETVGLALSGPAASSTFSGTFGSPAAAVLTITNSAYPGTLQLDAAAVKVNELAGSVSFTVKRTEGSKGIVTVTCATSDGTAAAGTHYTAANQVFTWADGDMADKTFTVTIRNNGPGDADKTFNVTLSGQTGGAALGTPSAAVVTITEGATATFLTLDETTQGTWKGIYGADGYNVIANAASYPAYATVTPAGNSSWTWFASTTDVRDLQKAGAATDRIGACWHNTTVFTIDVNLTDSAVHQVALYCLDQDTAVRRQTVEVLDADTNAVLDTRSLSSSFNGGVYLVWNISGHVIIRITHQAGTGPNAVVSGLFFGGGTNVAPAITTQPVSGTVTAGNTATFTVAASGSPAPTYQWQSNPGSGWTDVTGAMSATYTTPATVGGDNGKQFRCVAANSVSSATSDAATLWVIVYGDATGDMKFDLADINKLVDWLLLRETPPAVGSAARTRADVNGDGSLDLIDINIYVDRLLLRITKFPIEP